MAWWAEMRCAALDEGILKSQAIANIVMFDMF